MHLFIPDPFPQRTKTAPTIVNVDFIVHAQFVGAFAPEALQANTGCKTANSKPNDCRW